MNTADRRRIQKEINEIAAESHTLVNLVRVQEDDIIIFEEIE